MYHNAHIANAVFTSSTPDTRPAWCDSVGSWRVSHADRLEALVKQFNPGTYVDGWQATPSGRKQLWVGVVDNRDPQAHVAALVFLMAWLKGHGLKVKTTSHGGRVRALIVTDR